MMANRRRKNKIPEVGMRPICQEDLENLAAFRNLVSATLGDAQLVGAEEQRAWFESYRNDDSRRYFILHGSKRPAHPTTGEEVGLVRITDINWIHRSACIGGDIHPVYQRQGYGIAMMNAIVDYCFGTLNLHRLWLLVLEANDRARSLYKGAGFTEEGRQRAAVWRDRGYHDYIMMSLLSGDAKWKQASRRFR